uniref:ABC transporter substrate-binding protein n=1 Tax=Magnetococcus massalia (strain MO-1) TaxID=451514 RepID=A0A1S7LN30_MAGMO|nr:Conserved exported protein of unknown function. ABC-type uncharacterized transport system, periplasmic component [Candidatus Magnetococcus massalia]
MRRLITLFVIIAVVAAAGFWLSLPQEQQAKKRPIIGTVSLTGVDKKTVAGFRETLANLGHIDGQTVEIRQMEPAGQIDRLDGIIQSHLEQGVDMLFVSSTPATLAAKRLTAEHPVPVLFCPVNDPVGSGILQSLQQPGGNITGIRLPVGDQPRLQWLKTLLPTTKRVYFPFTPTDKSALATLEQVQHITQQLGIELVLEPVKDLAAMQEAVTQMPEVDAIFLPRDSSVESQIDLWVTTALKHKLPLSAPSYQQVERGALFCYGFVHNKLGNQAAYLADKILRGDDPGNLAVEMGENFLVINLKTARSIGLEIPDHLLSKAAMIIE